MMEQQLECAMTAMTDSELDAVYTRLCKTMTALGEAATPLYLARFALLAVERIGDANAALKLIDAAREDIDGSAAL
ncbi:hypothetical protein [Paraburkholderia tropica]|uniref:hypothetical protein n=1 Tax=Paraburkholderia tropica TaxID=92647 RepID=UPI003AFA8DA3